MNNLIEKLGYVEHSFKVSSKDCKQRYTIEEGECAYYYSCIIKNPLQEDVLSFLCAEFYLMLTGCEVHKQINKSFVSRYIDAVMRFTKQKGIEGKVKENCLLSLNSQEEYKRTVKAVAIYCNTEKEKKAYKTAHRIFKSRTGDRLTNIYWLNR